MKEIISAAALALMVLVVLAASATKPLTTVTPDQAQPEAPAESFFEDVAPAENPEPTWLAPPDCSDQCGGSCIDKGGTCVYTPSGCYCDWEP